MAQPLALTGCRILLLEDEMLASLLIEEILAAQNCVMVGPFDRITPALQAARSDELDAAVLDINIGGQLSFPVAEILSARRVPFVLVTGYGRSALPSDHQDWRVCAKPFHEHELLDAIVEEIAGAH